MTFSGNGGEKPSYTSAGVSGMTKFPELYTQNKKKCCREEKEHHEE